MIKYRKSAIRFCLCLSLTLFSLASTGQSWIQTDKIDAPDRQLQDIFGYDVDLSGSFAIAGATYQEYDANGMNYKYAAGAAYIYSKNTNGTWSQVQKLSAPDRSHDDQFGYRVAISETGIAVVSAPYQDKDTAGNPSISNDGAIYIYERNTNGAWTFRQKLVGEMSADSGDWAGISLAISGNFILLGSYFEDTDGNNQNYYANAGAVYVYRRDTLSGIWSFHQKLANSDRFMYDYFGYSLDIEGNRAIVGANMKSTLDSNNQLIASYVGAAYVFELQSSGFWTETQKLVAWDGEQFDTFGDDVAISGNFVVISSNHDSGDENNQNPLTYAGSAYIFKYSNGNWSQAQKIVSSDRAANDYFGFSISMSGSQLVVGSPFQCRDANGQNFMANPGAVYIFSDTGNGNWVETQKLVQNDRSAGSNFGFSVAISGSTMMAGAPYDSYDELANNYLLAAGSAYFFVDPTIGIDEISGASEFNLFPNPSSGLFEITNYDAEIARIYNAEGQLIREIRLKPERTILDLSGMESGVYNMALFGERNYQVKRLIILN